MADDELQQLVERLATSIGRSVVIDDPEIRPIRTSRHYGDEDGARVRAVLQRGTEPEVVAHLLSEGIAQWTRGGIVPARDDLDLGARWCVPLRWRGELLGYLMVIESGHEMDEHQRRLTAEAAPEAAALLATHVSQTVRSDLGDESSIALLLSDDSSDRARALAQRSVAGLERHVLDVRVTVAVVEDAESKLLESALRHAVTSVARSSTAGLAGCAVGSGAALLVQASLSSMDERLPGQSEAIVQAVRQVAGRTTRCHVGVGSQQPTLDAAWISRRHAELACRASQVFDRAHSDWRDLGTLAPWLTVPNDKLDETLLPPGLQALIATDTHGRLLETLEAYLQHAGAGPATADAIHVHRSTLYYRLDRIAEITGMDLADGDDRLALHSGIKLLSLLAATKH